MCGPGLHVERGEREAGRQAGRQAGSQAARQPGLLGSLGALAILAILAKMLEEDTGFSPCPEAEAAGGNGPPWSPLTAALAIHATRD